MGQDKDIMHRSLPHLVLSSAGQITLGRISFVFIYDFKFTENKPKVVQVGRALKGNARKL